MKGVNGAISWLTVRSASYSVWYAASLSRSDFDFQHRRLERRMDQLDSSSTNLWIWRAGSVASYASRPSVTDATRPLNLDRSPWSSTCRSPMGTTGFEGAYCSRLAYWTKNE